VNGFLRQHISERGNEDNANMERHASRYLCEDYDFALRASENLAIPPKSNPGCQRL